MLIFANDTAVQQCITSTPPSGFIICPVSILPIIFNRGLVYISDLLIM